MSKKKYLIRAALIILSITLLSGILVFCFKNVILNSLIVNFQNKFNKKYQCELIFKKVAFKAINSIEFHNIFLKPKTGDTLMSIQRANIEVDLSKLLTGNVVVSNLELDSGYLQLVKTGKLTNYDSFLNANNSNDTQNTDANFANNLDSFLTKIANVIPEKMKVNQVSLYINNNDKKIIFQSKKLTLENHILETSLLVKTNTFEQNWQIKGLANPRNKTADLIIKSSDTSKIKLPYIDQKYNLMTSFNSVRLKVDKIEMSFGQLDINGSTFFENLTINHPKIAKRDVVIKKAKFQYNIVVKSNSIAIDTASVVIINNIKVKPFVEYNIKKDTVYTLKMEIPKMKAQDFITSLPAGLFPHFKDLKIIGDFDYKLDFKFNKNRPNQLLFNSKIKKENLRIIAFGTTNLNKLNTEFVYQATDNGNKQRPVIVGLQNPMYTPLLLISPYLKKCVLTSEDPSFFTHRGFIAEAFKQSILKNIRTKKFSRGASTISMQLVKNVFLTREKTMSRKLEEILLVYILENNNITSKERMLEVYFNIIEWGPNVYGIGEAANFYFQKKPIDLTLSECLFLATIVPKPKKFMYQFDNQGNLKSFASKHHLFLSNIMRRRGLIELQDSINEKNYLVISGNARKFLNLKKLDSIPSDSLIFVKDEMLE